MLGEAALTDPRRARRPLAGPAAAEYQSEVELTDCARAPDAARSD